MDKLVSSSDVESLDSAKTFDDKNFLFLQLQWLAEAISCQATQGCFPPLRALGWKYCYSQSIQFIVLGSLHQGLKVGVGQGGGGQIDLPATCLPLVFFIQDISPAGLPALHMVPG